MYDYSRATKSNVPCIQNVGQAHRFLAVVCDVVRTSDPLQADHVWWSTAEEIVPVGSNSFTIINTVDSVACST